MSYGYNAKNLLTSTSSGATLSYDASDRLLSVSKSGVVTKFLYDGAGTVNKRYLLSDERASITGALDASGLLLGIYKYDEYGVPTASAPARFGYMGQTHAHRCKTLIGMTLFQ